MRTSWTAMAAALALGLGLGACDDGGGAADDPAVTRIPARPAQRSGDAAAGWDFLRYGDYVGSGVPYEIFAAFFASSPPPNRLDREGDGATVPYSFNVFETPTGVKVAGGVNCFGCHASRLDGAFVVGLGNAFSDFTAAELTDQAPLVQGVVEGRYGEGSPEAEAYAVFARGALAAEARSLLPFRGVNPAFMFEESVAAHRTADLGWSEEPVFAIDAGPIGSDVPAWWLLKKKNALYYNGMGRGDFARLIEQISVVATYGSAQTEAFDAHFGDVLAFIMAIEPPAYPEPVDSALAARGEGVFEGSCSACHGTYGEGGEYPNLLVGVERVGTDAAYADRMLATGLIGWYAASWYAEGTEVAPARAYVAPPLDGVWATAPYLHNGSVPTLAALLDSSRRPTYWRRDFGDTTYDHAAVGWPYTVESGPVDVSTYDTTRLGYGNGGHTFGDALSADDRRALLEYLKTL
ncbi:MAG: c-type cytochrome [Myxococcales bacterium]|nr:c-type cytochrome [Myxococcales bacterium]